MAFPLNGRVPSFLQGRGCVWEFQAMNLGLPLDCVATAPSTISDAIRMQAALEPQRPAIVSTDLPYPDIRRARLHDPANRRRAESRVANYVPENLDKDIYCFVCDENAVHLDYEPPTWRRLARAVHDMQVPGDHSTCVTTFAGAVANELQGICTGRQMR